MLARGEGRALDGAGVRSYVRDGLRSRLRPSDGLYAIAIAIADTTVLCINGAIFDVLGAFDCMFAVFAANGPTPSDSRDHETYVAFHLR